MSRTSLALGFAFTILAAGCLAASVPKIPTDADAPALRIEDADGTGIPYAQLTALAGGQVTMVRSGNATGAFAALELPPATTHVAVGAAGFLTEVFARAELPSLVRLVKSDGATGGSFLRFLPRVDLVCPSLDPPPYSCDRFGEPVVEVAGDGTIWASATCCIGRSPPIWTSRDGGKTFRLLEGEGTGLVRDATGIEGDFAIDEAGNVYFFDILAGAAWFSSYTPAGTHRWTLPQAWPPLVDRPWVRAGKADEVWAIYNTGVSTRVYGSADGGRTWDLLNGKEFACGLGNAGNGPVRNHVYVAASCGEAPKMWTSRDGGRTWDAGEPVPLPPGDFANGKRGLEFHFVPVADEAGNVYVTYTHNASRPADLAASEPFDERAVYVARRATNGTWAGPFQVSPGGGTARLAWPAAGREGHFAVAWYHAEGSSEDARSEWSLLVAASVDAASDAPHFQIAQADAEVLAKGPLERKLGDFLQTDLTPDGRVVVVYGKQVQGPGVAGMFQTDVQTRFVSSDGGLDLAPLAFFNGPKPRT